MRAVRHLALDIGPRPGTSDAYFEAAAWVEQQLAGSGWTVRRQRFPTPAGYSWNAPVAAGPSVNLVATRGDLAPDWLYWLSRINPFAHVMDAERASFRGDFSVDALLTGSVVLFVITILAVWWGARTFQKENA